MPADSLGVEIQAFELEIDGGAEAFLVAESPTPDLAHLDSVVDALCQAVVGSENYSIQYPPERTLYCFGSFFDWIQALARRTH